MKKIITIAFIAACGIAACKERKVEEVEVAQPEVTYEQPVNDTTHDADPMHAIADTLTQSGEVIK